MRLLVISGYWPRRDNVYSASFDVDQLAALVELGHLVDVLCLTEPWRPKVSFMRPRELALAPERVRVHQIIVPRFPEAIGRLRFGALANQIVTGRRIRAWLARHERSAGPVDGIIVHGERNAGISAGIWNAGRKRAAAMIIHGADPVLEALPEAMLHRHMGPSASNGLTKIIMVGNRLRSYASRIGYESSRLTVIPNGFRHPASPKAKDKGPRGEVRIVAVARLIKLKGLDDALQALARLQSRHPGLDWKFQILGDGPERDALAALTVQLGLADRVHFHGAVTKETVLRTLEQSQIFLLPSWNEAFGLVYLEAMAMGAAIIGCSENGPADFVRDEIDGLLVPPRDVGAISNALERMIVDDGFRNKLAEQSQKTVASFTWEENAKRTLSALGL